MGRPPRAIFFLLLLFCLEISLEERLVTYLPRSNTTVFSHIYKIGSKHHTEDDGDSSQPQEALGPPGSSRGGSQYEHTIEGPDQEHVVFTHRINLPPQTCGCPPGTEDTQSLLIRLQALEKEVRTLRDTCQAGRGCCPATPGIQASTGQTDVRTLCSHHGSFDLSRCLCECEPGWTGPTCAEPACPGGCGGLERGKCVNGRCQCRSGYTGPSCEEPPSCPDDCNDQGRCVNGRCSCFPGYTGPSCQPACPNDCHSHGQCESPGQCVCDPGYSGPDCSTRTCPSNCNRRGECRNGRCICEPGFTGPACGTRACPNDCSQRGRCLKGAVCVCYKGYTGPDCSQLACPEDCSGHGECQNGVCLCHEGFSGDDCSIEIPSIGVRVSNRDETSFRLEWNYPEIPVDGYEIYVAPMGNQPGESVRLSGTETNFERRGLKPGEEYIVTIRAEKGQRYGPPVTQTVRTRVAPPHGLRSSQETDKSVTLHWDPPASRPDSYIISYVPMVTARPAQALKRVELPAAPERTTLEDLDSSARYRVTLVARQSGENSRATSIIVNTAAASPSQPVRHHTTPSPSSSQRPPSSLSEDGSRRPGNKPSPGRVLSNATSARDLFMRKMTQNISAKLSPYNGTLLERLQSYLRATNFPLHGNRTIENVAWDIYIYLIRRKPEEVIWKVQERLDKETGYSPPKREFPIEGAESAYSDGYSRPDHTKPMVIGSSSDGIEVSLDGVRRVSDYVVIRYRDIKTGRGGEIAVHGDDSTALITGLDPGTSYHVEIHGVVKGHSSKSYSFVTSTAPGSPPTTKIKTTPSPTPGPETSLTELTVTDVSPNSLRVVWSTSPGSFRSFILQYRDTKSSTEPGEIKVPGTERSVTVPRLKPSTEYEMELRGEKPDGSYSGPLTTKISTAPAPEVEKPTLGELSTSEVTDNFVRLSWTVPTGNFDSFLIQYKDSEGKPKAWPVDGDSREAIISDLSPSRKYKFNLYGLVGRKRHGPVSIETFTAPRTSEKPDKKVTAPSSLGELSASDITSDSVRLSWSVPSGSFDSFLVQYKDSEGRPQVLPMEGDTREVIVPSLAPSRRYRFNLYGISDRKRFGPATTDIATAAQEEEPTPKPVFGEFSVSDTTSNSVRLAWTIPKENFDSFVLQYQDTEGNEQTLPLDRDTRETTIPNLVPSQTYRFNLYGVFGSQQLGPISVDATTAKSQEIKQKRPDETRDEVPSLGELSVSDVTSDSVHLFWTVPTGNFDSFLIQYKDADGKPQSLPVEGDSREVTIPNLVPSRRYKFNLYGVSGRKRSGPVSTDATTASRKVTDVVDQPSLGEISVSDVTSDSVRLYWTVPTGNFDSFLIQYKDADGKPQSLPVEGNSREVTIPNLVPSRRYKFNLYGVSGRKRSGPVSTDATTASQKVTDVVQPSLGEISVIDVTSDSVRLYWTVPTGNFDSFLIQYKDANGKLQSLPLEGGSREVTIPNLVPSHRYKFNLYGISGRKRSSPISTDATTVPLPTSPEVPTDSDTTQPRLDQFSVSDITTDSVHLSWIVPSGDFDSFLVQYKDGEGRLQALPVNGASRTVLVPDLDPSQRYKFNLYGIVNGKRHGPLLAEATTAPALAREVEPTAPPPSLGQLSAFDISSDSLRLSWDVPVGTFDSFLIQYKNAEGKPQSLPVDGASREVAISSLVPSRRYKFNLFGVYGRKRIGPVSTDAVTAPLVDTPTPPLKLGELTASNAMPTSLDLSWTVEAGDFDSFIIQYRDAEDKTQALPIDGGLRSLHLHDLAPSHRYQFKLYGVSGRKRLGPITTEGETAPIPTTPPPQPILGELSVTDVTTDSVRLFWTVSSGNFDSFLIQYKDVDGRPQALPSDGSSREITVTNLAPSRRYKFNLYGVSGRKRFGPVSADTITASLPVDPVVPPSLGELTASDITSNSVRLSWTIPSGNFDSFLVQYKDAEGKPQAIPVEGAFREHVVSNLVPSRRYKFNLYGLTGRKRLGPISTDAITVPAESRAPPTLGELVISNVTMDSAHLSWTVPAGQFDSFLVQYKDAEGKPQALPLDGNTHETTITGLSASRRYKFNLYGVAGRKRLGPVSADTVTAAAEQQREKPSLGELSVSDVTSDSVHLSWTVPTGSFDSFLIQYKDAAGKQQSVPIEGNTHETMVSGLAPAHRYKFNLYGVSGRKRLGPISVDTTTAEAEKEEEEEEEKEEEEEVKEEPFPTLGQLSVSETNSDSIRLSWSVPAGTFDSFLLQYEIGEDDIQRIPVDGSAREVTVPNLSPSQRYLFDLYGIFSGQTLGPASIEAYTAPSAREQEVEEKGTGAPLPSPDLGELSASDVTSNSVRLSWDVPDGTFDSFLVQYKDAENRPQDLPVDKETNSVIIYYLVPSYRYIFNLYGVSGRKRFGPVSVSIVTATADPDSEQRRQEEPEQEAPTGSEPRLGELSISEVTSNTVRLSWSVPEGSFDSFFIQYKDARGKPQELPVGGTSREVIVPNLVPSHRYRFNLYGISGNQQLGPISANTMTAATADYGKKQEGEEEPEQEIPTGAQPRLGKLSVSEVTDNAARLSWSVPEGSFDSFSIQYKDAAGRPQMLPVGGTSRETIVPNLVPSHRYKFNLYGISGNQRFGPISANAVTTATTETDKGRREPGQEAPTGSEPRLGDLSVSEVSSNTARLSWSVPEGSFDSFSIQYKDAAGRPQALPVGGTSREITVPNLVPSHKYRFNLYGISGNQRLGPISVSAVTTAPEEIIEESAEKEKTAIRGVQPRLRDATVSEITSDSLLLSWSVQDGSFDSFLIQYKDPAGKLQILPVDGTMRSLHLYNLTPLQRYKFNIFGVFGSKRLGPISTDAVTAPPPPEAIKGKEVVPPRLGELSVSKVTSDSITLSWTIPEGNFDSFLIQYKDAEGKPQTLPLSGDSRDVTIPSLASSHRYKFNLYGLSGQKQLGPISADAVTGPSPGPGSASAPAPATIEKLKELSAHDITPESLLLSWTVESGNFDSFIIQYRDADGKPHALPVDGGLRSMRLHDLVPSHRYKFNLYGVSGHNRHGPISTDAVTAPAISQQPPPPQPQLGELSASDITSTSVRLSWSVASGQFDSFIVQYRDAEGKPQALPVQRGSHDIVISNLAPSRKYKFNLYGISGRKRFGPISTETVTAKIKESVVQPTLGDLSISEVTKDSVRLSWTISTGEFDSFLIQYKDADGKLQSVPVAADLRTVIISNLMPSHRYKFNLYGISGRKRLGPISTDAVTAFPEALSERSLLENLVVTEVTPTTLQLKWESPEGEFDSFLVRCKDSLLGTGRRPPPAKEVTVPRDERSATIQGLTPNTEYSLTVYGMKDGLEAANINTGARTSGLELDSPRDLRFSDIHETSVVANWRPPSSRVDRYKVSFQLSDGGEPQSIMVNGSDLRATLEGLTPGASYEVTVMSLRGFEESEPLVGYVTTVPDGPSDLRAINVTDSSAVLTWQPAVAEMNNYIVTYGPAGGTRVSESVPGNRAQLRLSGLRLDTEYRASVYGEKEGNRSSPVSATFTTGADGPRDLSASEISPRSARLTWSPPRAPPGGYLLSYQTPSGQSKEIPLDSSVTSHELQDLTPSSRYQVQVQAVRKGVPTAATSTSFTTGHLTYPFPRDCSEESQNGPGPSRVTTIYLGGNQNRPLQVYCDMETDGGGWMVFQRRMNGETDFWRDWQDYATGFGNLTREFWLGNDALHQLTSSGDYELRVDLRAGNETAYAVYQHFRVDPPADYYRLHLGSYSGTAGDAFSYHSGSVFSTRDRDPNRLIIPCAVSYRGAWWYRNCHYTNLNGLYANNRDHQGVNWYNWKGFEFSIPFTEMKLRPRGFRPLRRA